MMWLTCNSNISADKFCQSQHRCHRVLPSILSHLNSYQSVNSVWQVIIIPIFNDKGIDLQ